jgi:UDP-N-acetyl-D-glucosamine/UDP-N-acetyl-D-galactosamine dehydrogenase
MASGGRSKSAGGPNRRTIAVVGLGYVGLPLAVRFGLAGERVIGFDVDKNKIRELQHGIERMGEVPPAEIRSANITLTDEPEVLAEATIYIIAVPTPITAARQPDLSRVKSAARMIGRHVRRQAIVVLESTVYPGVTEEVLGPIIEQESRLRAGVDFFLAYSPERANPGDREHTVGTVTKVVAAQDAETLEAVAEIYGVICKGGVYRAPNIKTAEAAKVIENIQRDLNIALVNELCIVFHRVGIDTREVLKAAATKWNFQAYYPGLVGGHCIGVDPYYLTHLAERHGYHPQVILAGRRVNESMADYVAELAVRGLIEAGKVVQESRVLILGLTFKENVSDIRNSKVRDIIRRLREYRIHVLAHDPLLEDAVVQNGFSVANIRDLAEAPPVDAVILAVPHRALSGLRLQDLAGHIAGRPVLVDVKAVFARKDAEARGFIYKCL